MDNILQVEIRFKHFYYLNIVIMTLCSVLGLLISEQLFSNNIQVLLYIRVNIILLCAIGLSLHKPLAQRVLLNIVGWFLLAILLSYWLQWLPKDFMTLTYGDSLCLMNLSVLSFFGSSYYDH
jgi:hypothetical protein